MKQLGVSIYPSTSKVEEDKKYLDLASKYGYTRVFTSLLEIKGDSEEVTKKYKEIIQYANSLNMATILDVNPKLFAQFGEDVSHENLSFFKELGASGLRLDLGFSGIEEAGMTKNDADLIIEVNMSSGTNYIDNVMSYRPNRGNLYASHNFYPQKYSGLSQEHFEKSTGIFSKYDIKTAAFVTSQEGELGPWAIQTGLPTLESHRYLPIQTQATHYRFMDTIDDLLIGNAYASEDELRLLSEAYLGKHASFELELIDGLNELERKVVSEEVHQYRGDHSAYMIRSASVREKYNNEDFPAHNTQAIKKGDILICNNDSGQYRGELQIALADMENDGDRNVLGHLKENSEFLLDYIKPYSTFILKI